MKKQAVHKVKGTICTNWADDFWTFTLVSRQRWDYDRYRHVLTCSGEEVAEQVMCLGDAVLFAQGYESGVADLLRKARTWAKVQRDAGATTPDILTLVDKILGVKQ